MAKNEETLREMITNFLPSDHDEAGVVLDEIDNEAGEEQKMTPEEVTDNLSAPISE